MHKHYINKLEIVLSLAIASITWKNSENTVNPITTLNINRDHKTGSSSTILDQATLTLTKLTPTLSFYMP